MHPARWLLTLAMIVACGDSNDDGNGDVDGESSSSSTSTTSATTTSATTTTSASTTTSTDTGTDTSEGSDTTAVADSSSGSGDSSESSTGTAACEGMTFFATSVGSGENGGNLGGLAGADATCQMLAEAVGQGGCTWHAYLSTADEDARDRIGSGPWQNAAGDVIAADVDALHTDGLSNGDPQHVMDESGMPIPGPEHDILTGSQEDGTLLDGSTCDDWTSDTQDTVARVGHSDIPMNPMFSPSWNSAHDTPGCRPQDLEQVGGAGRLYCFAI
ncbi:MAG TPA: hypothetical protein VG755_41380 [Nannocystaceae bacterium]|nr:hypothetical protein [Nannocystaceae bacterium]